MQKFQKFLPIQKMDTESQMVYGWASTDDKDSDGEIITIEALKGAIPEYMKFPTIREMHQAKPVGQTKTAEIKKENGKNGLWIGAKIVSQDAWALVKEGVYKAFSIGGNVIRRTGDIINELELVEISLVDVPSNKAATLEVFKNGKFSKDASTVWQLSDVMIQVKDMINYFEYYGKNNKKLKRILEQLKTVIADEAGEAEPDESVMRFVNALTFLKLKGEGVNYAMNKDIKKTEEVEDEVQEEAEQVETEETETEEVNTETEDETEEAEAEDEVEEDGEEKSADVELKKIDAITARLEKLDKTAKVEKLGLDKSVQKIAGAIEKMTTVIESLETRLVKLESQPAPTKSKIAEVYKSKAEQDEKVKKEATGAEKRLAELNDLFEKLGANQFAKQGYSAEASKLKAELERQ